MTVATLGWITLLLLMFTLTIPGPSYATIFVDSDFESGSTFAANGWESSTASPGHLEISTDHSLTGTHSVKGTFDNINGSSEQPSAYYHFSSSTHVFVRFAYRTSPGFQLGSNGATKIMRIRGANGGYPVVWILQLYGQYALGMEGPYDNTNSYMVHSGASPSSTSWDQLEFEVQLNTPGQSNGSMRIWVNGVLRGEQTGKAYVGPTDSSIGGQGSPAFANYSFDFLQIYVQSGLGSVYIDRVAVGNTRIGLTTGGGGGNGDTSPPVAPRGLTIQ